MVVGRQFLKGRAGSFTAISRRHGHYPVVRETESAQVCFDGDYSYRTLDAIAMAQTAKCLCGRRSKPGGFAAMRGPRARQPSDLG